LTDTTQQTLKDSLNLSAEALAKLNFALSLSGPTTHAIEQLQTHCELSLGDAETLAIALHLLSKVNYADSMITRPKKEGPNTVQSQNTLYIRNLPLNVTQDELQVAFENYGAVKEIRMQKEKNNGDFFGTVFVEYVHSSAAKLAQVQMDGKLWGINTVHVSFAKEKVSTSAGSTVSPNPTGPIPSSPQGNSLFVANLSPETDVPAVKQIFLRFGEIKDARLLTEKDTGQFKGVAFVDFVLPVSAAAAIDALNNQIHNGRTLKVSYAQSKKASTNLNIPPLGSLTGYPPFQSGYPDPYMGFPPPPGFHYY